MSSSSENLPPCVVQEEGTSSISLLPFAGPGCTAPPPTPLASSLLPSHPPHAFPLAPALLETEPSLIDDGEQNFASTSSSMASPPSKEDLDALAQYLLQQSLHSTPNLLASPTLHRKRRTSIGAASSAAAAAVQPDNDQEVHAANRGNHINIQEGIMQTFSYASGSFCAESRTGIRKACQDVGAFYIVVPDAEEALSMLRALHAADEESIVECGLLPLSQLCTSISQTHQDDVEDVLDIDSLTFDSSIDTTFRDTMTGFAKLLFRISKDLLRFLIEDLSTETQAKIEGCSLKPLFHVHGNGKHELNLENDVILSLCHRTDIGKGNNNTTFLARLGIELQNWSQGKYKAPNLRSLCKIGSREVFIQCALIHYH